MFVVFGIVDLIVAIVGVFYGEAQISFDYFSRSLIFLTVGAASLLILKFLSRTK